MISPSPRHVESVADVWLPLVCETCENEIDLIDESPERGLCRHCGVAFLLDTGVTRERRRVG